MKRILLSACILSAVAFLPIPTQSWLSRRQSAGTANDSTFTDSYRQLAFQLLQTMLHQDSSTSNKLISPLSMYISLGALYNGAGHATQDSIGETLHALSIPPLNFASMCKALLQQLPREDELVQVAVANSIWCNRNKTSLQPAFAGLADNLLYTSVQSLTFNGHAAAEKINKWTDQNTYHQIPTLLQETDPHDQLYLASALYFKSDWRLPFQPENTREELFRLPNGNFIHAPFMNMEATLHIFSDTSFTMVELPFGQGKNYCLYIILPENEKQRARDREDFLSPRTLDFALGHMTYQHIYLSIPRWQYDYTLNGDKQTFGRLGMSILFDDANADFSTMFKTDATNIGGGRLSKSFHKAYINVNEYGAEGAGSFAPPLPAVKKQPPYGARIILADHSFLYTILERQNNLPLLSGIVNDPRPATPQGPSSK